MVEKVEQKYKIVHAGPRGPELKTSEVDELFESYYDATFENDRENEEMKRETKRFIVDFFLQKSETILFFDENDSLVAWGGVDDRGRDTQGRSHFELRAIAVHPDHRGQGLSKRIIEELENDLSDRQESICIEMVSHESKILDSAVKRGYKRLSMRELFQERGWDLEDSTVQWRIDWFETNQMEGVMKEVVPQRASRLARLRNFLGKE